jgi:hypothetical protein
VLKQTNERKGETMNENELLSMLKTYGAVNVTGGHNSEAVKQIVINGEAKLIQKKFHEDGSFGWDLVKGQSKRR